MRRPDHEIANEIALKVLFGEDGHHRGIDPRARIVRLISEGLRAYGNQRIEAAAAEIEGYTGMDLFAKKIRELKEER